MQSTSKITISCLAFLLAACAVPSLAEQKSICTTQDPATPRPAGKSDASILCVDGQPAYRLEYDPVKMTVAIGKSRKSLHVVKTIPKDYDPSFVGGEEDIRFLPNRLQPYIKDNVLLFTTAQRSSAGDGMGQCGAGVERSLHVYSATKQKIISSFLITSCLSGVELFGSGQSEQNFDGYSIVNGVLNLRFVFRRGADKTSARISQDYKRLEPY